MKKKSFVDWLKDNTAIVGLVIVLLVGSLINFKSFFSFTNFMNVGRQATIRGLLACGMTLVIISGSIDLSVSTNFAMCGFLTLYFGQYSTVLGFVVPLLAGALVGAIITVMTVRWRFPAWVATIAMQFFLQGALLQLTQGNTFKPAETNEALYAFGNFKSGVLNTYVIAFVAVFVLFALLMKHRSAFRNIYAVGGNIEAARMMGISVFKTRLLVHVICGVLTALAGILLATRTNAAYPLAGSGYEMYAIAASVLGGIYLSGGRSKVLGTFVGAWILGFLNNIFNMQSTVNALWEQIITGSVIILVVVVQSMNSNSLISFKRKRAKA